MILGLASYELSRTFSSRTLYPGALLTKSTENGHVLTVTLAYN